MRTPTPGTTRQPRETAPVPSFRSLGWRAGDAMASALARIGIGPMHLLTTRGRRTGRRHIKPVVPVTHDGREWLVAPYGVASWVRNARAEGHVTLRYGRTTRRCAIRETSAEEAGPVLKRYLEIATKTRSQFRATVDSPVEDFAAEAGDHPVFELIPLGPPTSTMEVATQGPEGRRRTASIVPTSKEATR